MVSAGATESLAVGHTGRHPSRGGADIRAFGLLFVLSGAIDLAWIVSYPAYALTVFGLRFDGAVGWAVKLQHPVIHGMIGWGFFRLRRWALWVYGAYLGLACASEIVTQLVDGYHPLRTSMILLSGLFAGYVVARRRVFVEQPLRIDQPECHGPR